MKIAMLGNFCSLDEVRGGVDVNVNRLAYHLARMEGVELHVVTFGERRKDFEMGGIRIHVLKRMLYAPLSIPIETVLLIRKIQEINPDIIHVQDTCYSARCLAAIALRKKYPAVLTAHGLSVQHEVFDNTFDAPRFVYGKLFTCMFERLAVRMIPFIIVPSLYQKKYLRRCTNSRIFVISNGVDEELFRTRFRGYPDRLLFVGVISPTKRVSDLVQLMKLLVKVVPSIKLDIVGPYEYPKSIKKYAYAVMSYVFNNKLNNHVRFFGPMNRKELIQKYEECTLVVLPSQHESQGIVLLEAMACGKPVVASDIGGISSVIENGKTGLLFECANINDLYQKVLTLVRSKELRERLSKEGRRRAKNFTWEKIAKQTIELYKYVVNSSRSLEIKRCCLSTQ